MPKPSQTADRAGIFLSGAERKAFEAMARDFGIAKTKDFINYLTKCHQDGLLVVLNASAKECLVAAAEEKVLRIAKRAAREETHFVLYEEGFRTTPYET